MVQKTWTGLFYVVTEWSKHNELIFEWMTRIVDSGFFQGPDYCHWGSVRSCTSWHYILCKCSVLQKVISYNRHKNKNRFNKTRKKNQKSHNIGTQRLAQRSACTDKLCFNIYVKCKRPIVIQRPKNIILQQNLNSLDIYKSREDDIRVFPKILLLSFLSNKN